MARRGLAPDGAERPTYDADPTLAVGDHIFVHETGRAHLIWQMTQHGRPLVLIEGGFRALPHDAYLPFLA